jgi:hypothetical protein
LAINLVSSNVSCLSFCFVIILPVFLQYTKGFVCYDGSYNYNYLCNQCLSPLKL